MIKNITLSAEERLIQAARSRAQQEKTTLNDIFRKWLERYAGLGPDAAGYTETMKRLQHVASNRRYTRDEMNER
jgi:hypothetical protein